MRLLDQDSGIPAVFSNGNGVTFGTSGNTITAATGGVAAIAIPGKTYTSGTVVFSNSNGVTFGTNAQTVTMSVTKTQTGNLGGIAYSAGTITNQTVAFSNSNGISFGLNGSTLTASASTTALVIATFAAGLSNLGVTSGNTGTVASQIVPVGTNGIGLSGSTNGSSVTVSIQPSIFASNFFAGMGRRLMPLTPFNANPAAVAVSAIGFPINVSAAFTATQVNIPTAVLTSNTTQGPASLAFGMYTLNASTWSQASSGSVSWSFATSNSTLYSNIRNATIGMNVSATPGEYMGVVFMNNAASGVNQKNFKLMAYSFNLFNGLLGDTISSSKGPLINWGVVKTMNAGAPALPSSVAISAISSFNSGVTAPLNVAMMPAVEFCNVSY